VDSITLDRFLSKIALDEGSGCWNWTASSINSGYGQFRLDRTMVLAHRLSYEHFIGEIPSGLLICHTCDNKLCVNPEHLFAGTHKDNSQDMVRKGRHGYSSPKNPSHMTGRPGETNGSAKLDSKDVLLIRELAGSMTHRDIAEVFGISRPQVSSIIRRDTWRSV
jgi:hypothetical protein